MIKERYCINNFTGLNIIIKYKNKSTSQLTVVYFMGVLIDLLKKPNLCSVIFYGQSYTFHLYANIFVLMIY